ncbi:MAG: MFS transporter [Elusimicrobia bacterium]|nr:MFS transporter [Elusimicrobiota bacterium]
MDRLLASARHIGRSLKSRNFRLYFIGQLVSLTGTWMQSTAIMWLVYRLSGSSMLLGLVGFASQAPYILFGLFGGVAADRMDRRRLILLTQTASLIQALILAALTLTNAITVGQVLALSVALAVINAFDMPARQAYVVDLVDRADLSNALSLNSFMINASRIVGPAAAGFTVGLWGEGVSFLINAASFVAVIISVAMIRVPKNEAESDATLVEAVGHVRDGVRYSMSDAGMSAIIFFLTAISVAGAPYTVLLPIFSDRILKFGASGLGLLAAASGVGAVASSIYLARRERPENLAREMTIAATLFGGSLLAFAASNNMIVSMALMAVTGWGMMISYVAASILLQHLTTNAMRGRVMSLFTMAFMGGTPLGSLAAGWIAERAGAPFTMGLGGALCMASAWWFYRRESFIDPVLSQSPLLRPAASLGSSEPKALQGDAERAGGVLRIVLAAVLLGSAASARAQSSGAALTWEDCVSAAARANPDLAASRFGAESGKASYRGSFNGLLPSLSLSNSYTDSSAFSGLNHWQGQATAGLDIWNPSEIANIRSASADYASAIASLRKTSSDLRFNLRSAFAGLIFAQENVRVSEMIRAMRDHDAALVRLRYDSGRESKGNMLRARAQLLQAEADLNQSRRSLRTAQKSLDRQLGRDSFEALSVTGTLAAPAPPALPADLQNLLLNRPDVQVQEASLRRSRASLSKARSSLWPTLSASYSRTVQGRREFPNEKYGWTAAGLLSYSLFGGGPTDTYYAVRAASKSLEKAEQDTRTVRNQAIVDIESTWSGAEGASDQVRVQEALLEAARQRNVEADVRYESGLLTFDSWEIIASDRISAERLALRTRLESVNAFAGWERALGKQLGE